MRMRGGSGGKKRQAQVGTFDITLKRVGNNLIFQLSAFERESYGNKNLSAPGLGLESPPSLAEEKKLLSLFMRDMLMLVAGRGKEGRGIVALKK